MVRNLLHTLRTVLFFMRPLPFIGIGIIFVMNAIIAINALRIPFYSWNQILLGGTSCGLLASAAHALNDIYDFGIDKINKPFRPLPAGQLSIRQAWYTVVTLYITSATLALLLHTRVKILISLMALLTITYSLPPFYLKKYMFLSNLTLALCRGLLIVLAGWGSVAGLMHLQPWFIGLISFLFLLGATSTKDILDIEGDRSYLCKTLPVKMGIERMRRIIMPFFIIPFCLLPLGVYSKILLPTTLLITCLAFYGWYIVVLIKKKPQQSSALGNHIAWVHTYILYMLYYIGMTIAYFVNR